MKTLFYSVIFLYTLFFFANTAAAQKTTMDDVHLFQSFFRDAPITARGYGEALANYNDFELANTSTYGAQAGYSLTPEFEIAAGFYYTEIERDEIEDVSGVQDVPVYARYNFLNEETKLSGGAFVTLPVGSEDIGKGNTDFGVFGAVRHPASETVVLTGALGIDFLETGIDREASLFLGAGVIYAANNQLSVLGELGVQSDIDNSAISVGADYKVVQAVRLRGNLLLGLDIGAPDFGLSGGLLVVL